MRRALLPLALVLAACAPATVPASTRSAASLPVAAPAAPAPQAAAAPAPEQPTTPLPPWVARIDSPACSWITDGWFPRRVVELSARPGGPVIARVVGGKARVHVPVGAGDRALVDAASEGLALSGYASPGAIQLFATASFPLNGVIYPPSTTPLSFAEGSTEGVTITMDAPDGVLVKHPPLSAHRPCTDVSLDSGARLSPVKAAFGKEYGERRIVHAGQTLEVFADPTKPADVQLVLSDDAYADVFATSGAFSRIGAFVNKVYVAGWVRTSNLGEEWGGGLGSLTGFGRSGIVAPHIYPVRTVLCGADVPLIAEADGERATVGHVLAGTRIGVVAEGGPFQPVHIENRAIHPAVSSTFLARASDLARCEPLLP